MALFKSIYDAIDAAIATFKLPAGGTPLALASRVNVDNNGNPIIAPDPNGTSVVLTSSQDALTAFAGGGQANGTAITASIAVFSTVATAADSGKLPTAVAGMEITVMNGGASSMNVFPQTGDFIDGTVNASSAIVNGKATTFLCSVNGKWRSLKGA